MYSKTTANIKVTVEPFYLDMHSAPDEQYYVWAYTVQLENMGADSVQLLNRYWRITDARGNVQEVSGAGVIGEQPVIEPGDAYEYTSGVPLHTSSGFMAGKYEMCPSHAKNDTEKENFWIEIPAFSLDSPHQKRRPN